MGDSQIARWGLGKGIKHKHLGFVSSVQLLILDLDVRKFTNVSFRLDLKKSIEG